MPALPALALLCLNAGSTSHEDRDDNTSLWTSHADLAPLLLRGRARIATHGCDEIYIDMGTNVGHMLSALYSPKSLAHPSQRVFNEQFSARTAACQNVNHDTMTAEWGATPVARCEEWAQDRRWGALKDHGTLKDTCATEWARSNCAKTCCRATLPVVNHARAGVCTLSFEPVAANAAKVRALVAAMKARGDAGSQLHFFAAAIGAANGVATFHLDNMPGGIYNNWGSSLLQWQHGMESQPNVTVPSVGLKWLLTHHVARKATVVAKMDIEGAEYDVVPAAYAACASIDRLLIETHDRFFSPRWKGHRSDMPDGGRVARLRAALSEMERDRQAGKCRTQWSELGSYERLGRRSRIRL